MNASGHTIEYSRGDIQSAVSSTQRREDDATVQNTSNLSVASLECRNHDDSSRANPCIVFSDALTVRVGVDVFQWKGQICPFDIKKLPNGAKEVQGEDDVGNDL